jgi:RNA polymerase sigma-70 factor (ECF subfamily)
MQKAEFRRFYEHHVDRVYRFILFRVGMRREVAEDLTSEIFMKALDHFADYDPEKSQSAWIMTIARNHLINHYRDKKEQIDIDDVAFTLMGSDGRTDAEVTDDRRCLYEALAELESEERKIIELKYLQGFPYGEIAELIKKTAGAARIEAHRAMKKLKSIFYKKYASGAEAKKN